MTVETDPTAAPSGSHRAPRCARCDWAAAPADDAPGVDQLLAHADDAGHPVCAVDRLRSLSPTEVRVCDRCSGRARAAVADLSAYWPLLVVTPTVAPARRYDGHTARGSDTRVPGGRLAVLRGRGTTGDVTPSKRGSEAHLADMQDDDPTPVLDTVADIADGWRRQRGDQVPAWSARHWPGVHGYVAGHLTWALNAAASIRWDVLTLRAVRDELAHALGMDTPVDRSQVRCLSCEPDPASGLTPRLIRGYDPLLGRDDDWHCPRCGRVYDPAAHALAFRAWLDGAAGAA